MSEVVFKKPESMIDMVSTYCPGCGHGIVHRIIGEIMDELNMAERMILCAPIGCAGAVGSYFVSDMIKGCHGRASAIATAVKRLNPDKVVMTYQGDGDLAAIGTAEVVHAAGRGERITVIMVNNAIYGMTGGQMAPTTLEGQVTATSTDGRDNRRDGYSLDFCKILSQLDGTVYAERVAVNNTKNITKAKAAIKRAFQLQLDDAGFTFVEVLSACPTNWGMNPVKANQWVEEVLAARYPLGVVKEPGGSAK